MSNFRSLLDKLNEADPNYKSVLDPSKYSADQARNMGLIGDKEWAKRKETEQGLEPIRPEEWMIGGPVKGVGTTGSILKGIASAEKSAARAGSDIMKGLRGTPKPPTTPPVVTPSGVTPTIPPNVNIPAVIRNRPGQTTAPTTAPTTASTTAPTASTTAPTTAARTPKPKIDRRPGESPADAIKRAQGEKSTPAGRPAEPAPSAPATTPAPQTGQGPAVWRNPRTGEVSSTPPGGPATVPRPATRPAEPVTPAPAAKPAAPAAKQDIGSIRPGDELPPLTPPADGITRRDVAKSVAAHAALAGLGLLGSQSDPSGTQAGAGGQSGAQSAGPTPIQVDLVPATDSTTPVEPASAPATSATPTRAEPTTATPATSAAPATSATPASEPGKDVSQAGQGTGTGTGTGSGSADKSKSKMDPLDWLKRQGIDENKNIKKLTRQFERFVNRFGS